MMFLPTKFEKTYAATVGVWPKRAKYGAVLGYIGSGALFQWVSPSVGFLTLVITSLVHTLLVARENYIDGIRRISTVSDLRFQLLPFNREFVLKDLQRDAEWRGDEVDPEVSRMLQEIENNKTQLADRLNKWAQDLFDEIKVPPSTDKN